MMPDTDTAARLRLIRARVQACKLAGAAMCRSNQQADDWGDLLSQYEQAERRLQAWALDDLEYLLALLDASTPAERARA